MNYTLITANRNYSSWSLLLRWQVKIVATMLAAATLTQASWAQAPNGDNIFDSHVHLHDGEVSLKKYEAQLGVAKLHGVSAGVMWFGGPNQALAGNPDAIRAGNDALIALAKKHRKLLPIATVHPYDGEAAIAELERIAAKGVRILKIHPHTQQFDAADGRTLDLVRLAGTLDMVVLMDNANILPGDSEKLFNLALQAPKTKFVFAHLGGLNFRFWNILAAARTADGLFANNIHFDISAIVAIAADSPVEEEFIWTLRNVGVDNVLIGSDYPQYSLGDMLAALDRLGLTDAEKQKIRYGNAQRLFGLSE